MKKQILINEITQALDAYCQAITRASDAQSKEDYARLAAIAERIIAAMQADDTAELKLCLLGFSRQVSDSFAAQPPEFKALAHRIAEAKKQVI